MIVFDWTLLYWISGLLLTLIWLVPALQLALHFSEVADLTQPEWNPPQDTALPSLTIVVPARNEEAEIEAALRSLLQLNYPRYQIVAVNDRSTDQTGAIMERLAAEPASTGKLRVIHVRDLPSGWLGKVHAMWLGSQINGSQINGPRETPLREMPRCRPAVTGFYSPMLIASFTLNLCAAPYTTRPRPPPTILCFFPPRT